MHGKKLYGTATVGTKGQVVIPADARKELGITEGERLYVMGSPEKQWIGFIKEDQFRALLEHLSDNIESYRSTINSNKAQ